MKKYIFDVDCLIRDGESFFSLYFKDLAIIVDDLFDAYESCYNYVHNFLNRAVVCDYFFIVKRMECDNFE